MRLNQWLVVMGIATFVSLAANTVNAQERDRGGDRSAEFRQRMMDRYKERLEITDDGEWKAIQPLIQKVMDARMASFSGMGGRGFFGGRDGGRGDDNGNREGGDRDRGRGGAFGQPNPDAEALQRAIDAKASNSEMKAALAKLQESRKAKQAEVEKAQADLRKVLSVRQEAIATMSGLL